MRAMRSLCTAPMARSASPLPRGIGDEAVQLRPLGERHHQGGGRGSLYMTNHLAVAAVVATETAMAETAMAVAGWATTAAEAATALGAKWPEAPRDRLEATSLRTSGRFFPEGGLVASSRCTKSRRAAILSSCAPFWTAPLGKTVQNSPPR